MLAAHVSPPPCTAIRMLSPAARCTYSSVCPHIESTGFATRVRMRPSCPLVPVWCNRCQPRHSPEEAGSHRSCNGVFCCNHHKHHLADTHRQVYRHHNEPARPACANLGTLANPNEKKERGSSDVEPHTSNPSSVTTGPAVSPNTGTPSPHELPSQHCGKATGCRNRKVCMYMLRVWALRVQQPEAVHQ